jgi:hypothetical protein
VTITGGPHAVGLRVSQLTDDIVYLPVAAGAHYFRTSDGHEIDLVVRLGTERVALEV